MKLSRVLLATLLTLLARLFLLPEIVRADVLVVSTGQSINAALQKAQTGDTVLVQPGSYQEAIQLQGGVVLRSQGGASVTYLLPLPGQAVVTAAGPGPRTLDGFTIDGGYVAGAGVMADLWDDGALAITNSLIVQSSGAGVEAFVTGAFARLAMAGCVVAGNVGVGLALDADQSSAVVTDNEFAENGDGGCFVDAVDGAVVQLAGNLCDTNQATVGGGMQVIAEWGGQMTLIGNRVEGNTASQGGGIDAVASGGGIVMVNNDVHQNRATSHGGLSVHVQYQGFLNCTQNTVAENDASDDGVSIYVMPDSVARIANDIFWGNTAVDYTGPAADHSVIGTGNNGGVGNLAVDPRFSDPENDDYRLCILSPCIDAGDSSAVPPNITLDAGGSARIRGAAVDPGAYEYASARQLIADLRAELDEMAANGQVSSATAASLRQRLLVAEYFLRRRRGGAVWALVYLNSFMSMAQAQSGVSIDPAAAASLRSSALAIYAQIQRWGG